MNLEGEKRESGGDCKRRKKREKKEKEEVEVEVEVFEVSFHFSFGRGEKAFEYLLPDSTAPFLLRRGQAKTPCLFLPKEALVSSCSHAEKEALRKEKNEP